MESTKIKEKLKEVDGLFQTLHSYDNANLSDDKYTSNAYSAAYRAWYNGVYELATMLITEDDADVDVDLFRSVMRDNDGNAAVLRDNFHKVEAVYKALVIKIGFIA